MTKPAIWNFHADFPGEYGAGLYPFHEKITVILESGKPIGEEGEFENFIKECLEEWYDGAKVTLEER